MAIRPTRPTSRFQRGIAPRPVARPQPAAPQPPAEEPPAEEEVAPGLIAAPDETDSRAVPVLPAPQEEAAPAPAPRPVPRPVARPVPRPTQKPAAPPSRNLQNLEALVSESKAALEKAAALESELAEARQRLEVLAPLETRAGELQEQLAAVMAERDRNAEGLAEAQRQLEELAPLPAQVKELSEKLDGALRMRAKIAQEHAKLKSRLATFEGQAKELIDHLKASESGRRKAETALANAKEERNEYKFRLMSVRAVADGGDPPARSKQAEEDEKAGE